MRRTMFHFAYGSNLDLLQMQLRCPNARFVSAARLDSYDICFPRRSNIRNSATISIEESVGESVWGALYELAEADIRRLDDREGYNPVRSDRMMNRHNRRTLTVECLDGRRVQAEVYVAVPMERPGLPSAQYIGYLVSSAAECGLPKSHLVKLAQYITEQPKLQAA